MKTGARQIIGKTITGAIIKRAKGGEIPRAMLFITFDDGTYYEFYSMHGEILNTGGVVVSGGFAALLRYLQDTHDIGFCAIESPERVWPRRKSTIHLRLAARYDYEPRVPLWRNAR